MSSVQTLSLFQSAWIAEAFECARAEVASCTAAVADDLCIAGRAVQVRYADAGLCGLLGPATRHLRHAHDGPPALTIDCWSAPGPALATPADWPATGTVHIDDGTVVATWDALDGTLRFYDRASRRAWIRFDSCTTAATLEPAGPFRRILYWWAADNGLQLVHAAAVGHADGGLLLVGRGGSGKSTTSLACLAAGLAFVGEDSCVIEAGDPSWVHGLYQSAKGDARTATLLTTFTDEFTRSTIKVDGESVIYADRVCPAGVSRGFPLLGIVVPRLSSHSASPLSPIGPAAALRALAPSTLMQVPSGDRGAALTRMASIVRDLPAWELTIGPDPAAAAESIRHLLEGLHGQASA